VVNVLGFDIGGANTKAAFVKTQNGQIQSSEIVAEYFPIWKESQKLSSVLYALKEKLTPNQIDALALTMTAELSDAYQTKREGVKHIVGCVTEAFSKIPIYILNVCAELQSVEATINDPWSVAAANWAATGWLVAQTQKNCVVVDVGSTSTSIIPIVEGKVAAGGKTDLAKLICGELVYTGSLRTNVAAIIQSVPIKEAMATVASELFALSGDVHIVLGHLSPEDYSSETADGRGKTVAESQARLARVVCADIEMLSEQETHNIAQYIYEKQLQQIAQSLAKVYEKTKLQVKGKVPVVVTGLGRDFLARKAAERIGVDAILDLGELLDIDATLATPAFAVALMAANKIGESQS
jgi:(4-(4-[2-(gamma-L-glutamylamino)ethyl]phenoxymethyl)furan-2-yl)methanamine synthase